MLEQWFFQIEFSDANTWNRFCGNIEAMNACQLARLQRDKQPKQNARLAGNNKSRTMESNAI